jgi:hypothetical protein
MVEETKTIITYNVTDDIPENERGFKLVGKLEATPNLSIVKENFLKGQFGFKDLYIRHIATDELFIISHTHQDLTRTEKRKIIRAAEKWLAAQN